MASNLEEAARVAVAKYPDSDIELAIDFFQTIVPAFIGTSNDRLVKAGRSIKSLVDLAQEDDDAAEFPLEASLEALVEECTLLVDSNNPIKVPKVRFGKTELQMPIVTLGCMRFQQEWGPRISEMNQVDSDCQDNLVAILKQAILGYGMTHIETARGYGCSELQLGAALKQLFLTNQVKRENLIIQTKIGANKDANAFRKDLETSFANLQVDYVDLFAFHGLHTDDQLAWMFDGEDNCWSVIEEYKKAGKIRHVGFSTHAATEFTLKNINRDVFEYVNLHYHYFGSYTASGGGHDGHGTLDCVKLLKEKDMGIFIISPYDKGGRLYEPSRTLRRLTLPVEPMTFKSFWIWNHHRLQDGSDALPQLHTFTVGAARPSDLDQPAVAAYLHATKPDETLAKLKTVVARLEDAKEKALGKEWVQTWWKGLPKSDKSKTFVEHNQIIWIYNCIKAFGMYEFGKSRYQSFEKNGEKWDDSLSPEENIENLGRAMWGFVPGLPLKPGANYDDDLVNVPKENLERVKEAEAFVYKWCHEEKCSESEAKKQTEKRNRISFVRRNFSVSSQMLRMSFLFNNGDGDNIEQVDAKNETDAIPKGWEPSYDMRTWPDFPDRPFRA